MATLNVPCSGEVTQALIRRHGERSSMEERAEAERDPTPRTESRRQTPLGGARSLLEREVKCLV